MEDKKKVEAVLFAIGDKIELEEISRLTNLDIKSVKSLLQELQKDYNQNESPLMIIDEGNKWKLTVREEYMPIVEKIVPHIELSKTIMSTLAVIAWKAPVLQSDIIRIRTNKAYDHIKELEEMGFISKQRHGRSYMIRLAQKFYEYFDLKGKEEVQEKFKEFKDVSEADVVLEEIEERVETYGPEKLGELEVVDRPKPAATEEKLGELDVFEEKEQKPRVETYEEQKPKPKVEVYENEKPKNLEKEVDKELDKELEE